MKVFLSWSGDRSRQVAEAVRDWLPFVVSEIEPFMSSEIEAGVRWQSEIAAQLESTEFGIIFVTNENQRRPWLNFEAGALAKSIETSRVVPLAIDLKPSDIKNPLGQFQSQQFNIQGIKKIASAINKARAKPADAEVLGKIIDRFWPDLHAKVTEILHQAEAAPAVVVNPARTDRDMLEELLATVRSLSREQPTFTSPAIRPHRFQEVAERILGRDPDARIHFIDLVDGDPKEALILHDGPLLLSTHAKLEELASIYGIAVNFLELPDQDPR